MIELGCEGSSAGLPLFHTRWVISRKLQLLSAIEDDLITLEEASDRYLLTMQELLSWQVHKTRYGERGLLATQVQKYRKPEKKSGEPKS